MSATSHVRAAEAPPKARVPSSPFSLRWNVTPMCSRCSSSSGAARHMTSIASWSPRKSDPLTVSYACDSHVSSGLSAALIPPAAATECERTGCTLLMIATEAPSSAAARAARWPARPAPMIRTSCAGMGRQLYRALRRGRPAPGTGMTAPSQGAAGPSGGVDARAGPRRGERPAHLVERHDAAEALLAVDDHQRAEAAQALGSDQLLDRRVPAHERVGVGVGIEHLAHRHGRPPVADRAVHRLLAHDAEEAPEPVDDRKPRGR